MKHTTGKWKAEKKGEHWIVTSSSSGWFPSMHIDREEDARLIAAAPELLEALDKAHLEIIKLLNEGNFGRKVVLDLGYIVDAIAKAEGKNANARLIAAAPDMLAYLKWYVQICEDNEPAEGNFGYQTALELIAKAEGKKK